MKEIVRAYQEAKGDDEEDFVVFFRVSDEYVVLFDDASMINSKIGIPIVLKQFADGQVSYSVIKEDYIVSALHQLENNGIVNFKLIETQEFEL